MIPTFNDSGWVMFDSIKKGDGFFIADDGSYVRLFDDNSYAALKKVMYTVDIIDGNTYTLDVSYSINNIKHESMVYGLITLYNPEDKTTRRMYLDRPSRGKLQTVFKANNEIKVRVELGLKSYGDVKFYPPVLKEGGEIKSKYVKLAAVHIKPIVGIAYQDNLKRIEEGLDKAADMGADLICFAETINDRLVALTWEEKFESMDGTFCTLMKRKAKEKGVFLFFSFHHLDENGARRSTAVLLDRKGEIVGTFNKSNLTISEFDAGMVPGDEYPVFDTELGKIGMLICWDSFFPESSRAMALRGAEILLISTAGNPTHRHFARAKENGVYVVVACTGTKDEGVEPTKIISPKGEVLAQQGESGEIAFAEVDLYDSKNRDIYWLSVGSAWGEPNNIYMNEVRPDLFDIILPKE